MTTAERLYSALAADSQLIALFGGTIRVYRLVAPQNLPAPAGWEPGEFAYTVYRDLPATGIVYTLGTPSKAGFNVRRFAFESWSTGSTPLGVDGPDHVEQISNRIERVLAVIAEPTGVGAVYPDAGMPAIYNEDQRSSMMVQNFTIHTALD